MFNPQHAEIAARILKGARQQQRDRAMREKDIEARIANIVREQTRRDRALREKDIEALLVKAACRQGGLALKLTSPAQRSLPDRLIVMPKGLIYFVECKAPKRKPTEAQLRAHQQLQTKGARVYVVDSRAAVERFAQLIDEEQMEAALDENWDKDAPINRTAP